MSDTEKDNLIRSVQRSLKLLGCLDSTRPSATLTNLAQLSGLSTSTVQRLLVTLEHEDFLRRQSDGSYTFGSELARIGASALHSQSLYHIVEPCLESLRDCTGETANFAVPNGKNEGLYLRQALSRHSVRHAGGWLGRTVDCRKTAIGAALLGQVDNAGVAVRRATLEPDVTAVAVPIFGPSDDIVGAVSITGPTYRIDDIKVAQIIEALRTEAVKLSKSIGGRWRVEAEREAG